MKSFLKSMQKKNSGISEEKIAIFDEIIRKHETDKTSNWREECDIEFTEAMEAHLTQSQRYGLYEQSGSCKGTGYDKERKIFALEHADKSLTERLALFTSGGREAVLNDDHTITVTFACHHGYYKQVREEKLTSLPSSIQSYFERCAGGRLYEYQKALGIKLKIKLVDTSSLKEDMGNPVIFTFEIID